MELIIFLAVVGVIAACMGVWALVQMHKESKSAH